MNTAELALERERLAAEIAHKPEDRLAQVDAELARRGEEAAAQRVENRAGYERARDGYLEARDRAWEATREYVVAIEQAALARREMDRLASRDGARPSGEVIPEPCYVQSERDWKLRELRSLARSASTHARW
jgi:hypothetical protein